MNWKCHHFLIIFIFLLACQHSGEAPLFRQISPDHSGISFNNQLPESDSLNILDHEFMYNGGGVGIGDFNRDGLQDLFFSGNLSENKLYLNKGNFEFEDVSQSAGLADGDRWSSGVAIVDLNQDGWMDIYISATFREDKGQRLNQLWINQGEQSDGKVRFENQAAAYGLEDSSYTTQTYFFDYDLDGDLDAFMLNDKLFRPRSTTDLNLIMEGGEATFDKLFRNDDGHFVNVSKEAGIQYPGFGLGAAIFDVNSDGYPDIYVSNDFISNDLLYVNQQDGTFKNEVGNYLKHHSFSSMGMDLTDLNGDGLQDFMTLDMLPANYERTKRTYAFQKYQFYDLMERKGFSMQYNRNTLQISDPNGPYRDISQLAGVDATEWSWSVLFSDLDNDGLKDIAITNGYPRDITDMDFSDFNTGMQSMLASKEELLAQIPNVKVSNFFFQNKGQYQFENKSQAWGIRTSSYSNGAAVADLDNDGDLDYVINNINDPAHIYENRSQQIHSNHYLRIHLNGKPGNLQALGAQVKIKYGDKQASVLNYPQRGYLSTIEPYLHFGLGQDSLVDSLWIIWPDGSVQFQMGIHTDQVLEIVQSSEASQAAPFNELSSSTNKSAWFIEKGPAGIDFVHEETPFQDFDFQRLLQRMYSREGPGLAVGDLNGDRVDDLIAGNGSRKETHLYLSQPNGNYRQQSLKDIVISEDMGILIFDPDQDGVNEVYISCGSTEFREGSGYYYDKFYENDGQGNLKLDLARIPQIASSAASVCAADIDRDGDLDLFVSGRIFPLNYPHAVSSYVLKNENGQFVEANESLAPGLTGIGMVSQGLWSDFNGDDWPDLILVGEWMPIQLFENKAGKLVHLPHIPDSEGWWNSISGADLDLDGDIDYVLGNQGLNNKVKVSPEHPAYVFAHDFDQNSNVDPIMISYRNGGYYPVHLKMDLLSQLVSLKGQFTKYEAYAKAQIDDIFPQDSLEKALKLKVVELSSSILWNETGSFRLESLPTEAQFAPIYASLCKDINGDQYPDIILCGNRFNTEVFEGRHDAFNGLVLLNDQKGGFHPLQGSGFTVAGDARTMVELVDAQKQAYILVGINEAPLKIFRQKADQHGVMIQPKPEDFKALIELKNGARTIKELYFGSGFLSQSSRAFFINPQQVLTLELLQSDGNIRKIALDE